MITISDSEFFIIEEQPASSSTVKIIDRLLFSLSVQECTRECYTYQQYGGVAIYAIYPQTSQLMALLLQPLLLIIIELEYVTGELFTLQEFLK